MCKMRLIPGIVDREHDYVELLYGDTERLGLCSLVPVAVVAPGQGDCFVVQFTIDVDNLSAELIGMLEEVQAELEYYLINKHEADPWVYTVYHCGAANNWYSRVHWVYRSRPCSPSRQ